MKQLISTLLILLVISVSASAQSSYSKYNGKTWEQLSGSGKLVQLTTPVTGFSKLEVSHMNAKVVIESGAAASSLSVSIDDNLKDFFRYKHEGATLKIYFDLSGGKYDRWLSDNNTVVTVKVPLLESLINNGNTAIEVKQMNQASFSLLSDGNADIILNGSVTAFLLQSNGNSDIKAGNFLTQITTLSSNGNSEIVVNAKELVEKNVSGNNEIINRYYTAAPATEVIKPAVEYVSFKLRNNSLLPAKVSVISYRPDEKGNGTTAFVMMPYGTKSYRFPVGTKIYLASQEQVNTAMSGAKISDQPPFLIVKKEDKNKTFNINQ
jgi:hypothetical protein